MKNFKQFNEAVNANQKQAALRARQQAAVAKYKSSGSENKTSKPKQESEVHQGDVKTQDLRDKRVAVKQAAAKATARKAEIQRAVQSEIQKQKGNK